MQDILVAVYPWTKSLHVISVISWMAAMLYLPRLYVYHADAEVGSQTSETFKVMEQKLYTVILLPAMSATWIFGLLLLATPGIVDWSSGYIWVKLTAVLAMTGFHGFLSRWRKAFAADKNTRPSRFYRMVNELPAVLMVIIVVMIIARPF